MLSAWLLMCTLQSAAPWQARSHGPTLEMDLPANAVQMGGAFTRRRGVQQVVWIPGLQGVANWDSAITDGPVRRVQVMQKKLGVVLVLTPQTGVVLRTQTTLLGAPQAMLRVGPPMPAAPEVAKKPEAPAHDSSALAWTQSGAPMQPSHHETAWSPERQGWPQESGLAMHPLTWVAWGIGCSALLALAFVLRRRTPLAEHGGINIVAVRALGPRHKLALVTAGGERMLLATSDKEVVLLSHLGPTDNVDLEAVEPPKPFNLESVNARKPAPANMGPLHTPDVLGLLRLRRAGAAA